MLYHRSFLITRRRLCLPSPTPFTAGLVGVIQRVCGGPRVSLGSAGCRLQEGSALIGKTFRSGSHPDDLSPPPDSKDHCHPLPPFPHPIVPQYDMNRLKRLYSNTNKTNDALSLPFILRLTHPHLVNDAYGVCGGQRAATESSGRRWLGDFPVTLYLTTLRVRVVTQVTSILVHCLSIAFLSCPCNGQNRPNWT